MSFFGLNYLKSPPIFVGVLDLVICDMVIHNGLTLRRTMAEKSNESTEERLSNSRDIDEEVVKNLALGLTTIYQPTLKALKSQLLEITKKQEFLNDELHKENLRLSEAIYNDELQKMFLKIKLYRDKLSLIKRDMMVIHEQSVKLKKRALKLEQQKQKEALEKRQKREYEELLISKPSTS